MPETPIRVAVGYANDDAIHNPAFMELESFDDPTHPYRVTITQAVYAHGLDAALAVFQSALNSSESMGLSLSELDSDQLAEWETRA